MRNFFSNSKRAADAPPVATLAEANVGCEFRIETVEGKSCDQLRKMGFCESMKVKKLSNGRNLVCTVCGVKMALSRKLADQIIVCPA